MKSRFALGVLSVLLGLVWLGLGCERTETDRALRVTPSDVELVVSTNLTGTVAAQSVTLVVELPETAGEGREIYYPLEWSVRDATMGSIRTSGGDSAVYVGLNRTGVNSVLVRDQTGAEGVASIVQTGN